MATFNSYVSLPEGNSGRLMDNLRNQLHGLLEMSPFSSRTSWPFLTPEGSLLERKIACAIVCYQKKTTDDNWFVQPVLLRRIPLEMEDRTSIKDGPLWVSFSESFSDAVWSFDQQQSYQWEHTTIASRPLLLTSENQTATKMAVKGKYTSMACASDG